ncbi:MAG: repeat:Bacterial transcriptional activator domain:Tetratricopeptide 4, partial [Bryobacterales bacterium]|nr:repeat:Bacterial transcriptional activator domain:Tetratricopeptide 4 [Bryobacterales bacterium]
MRIELFGNLQIACGPNAVTAVNTNRLQSLLAYLILNGGAPQSREHLAFLLWPESNEQQARTNLRQLIHHLRRALPAEYCLLAADNHTVQWPRDPGCSIDVVEFDAAVDRSAEACKSGDRAGEREALEAAARLYQDDLVRGLYDDWLQPKREHYRQQLTHVLSRLTALLEDHGDYAAAIASAERLVAHDPLRESHHQALIRLHARNQDRAGALRAYHQCMRILRRELALEPGPGTKALFEQVLKSERLPEQSARAGHGELPPAAAPALPMIGRQNEWARLMECWRRAAQGGIHFAVILGEPGIGKSRLAEELSAWCSTQRSTVAHARCYGAQGQLAYAPVAEWLRSKPARAACSKLPRTQLAELARVLPEILLESSDIPRPNPLSESWERHHFYESLNAAFAGIRKPLLLTIDDLQWCDQDSFEWLHAFFRSPAPEGTLVLATVRPEETGRNHPFTRLLGELRGASQAMEFPLEPLDAEETAALAARVAGRPLQSADLAGIYRSTRGNPLFVVESVRAGMREGRGDPDVPAGMAAPKIQAVIAARLAQLSAAAYQLAGMASAVGQSFSFELLAKATDWDEDSLASALDELWQRRIVEAKVSASQYDFTHDRLREVAYAELSPVRRRFLHRRIARALEELHSG